MKRIAFLIPPDLQADGRLLLDDRNWFSQIVEQIGGQSTLIVRQIGDKRYEDIPNGVEVLVDLEKPEDISAEGFPSYTQANIHSWKSSPMLAGGFDCAIAFQGLSPWCLATTMYRIQAKRKLVYLQNPPSWYLLEGDISYFKQLFRQFDSVLCASKQIFDDYVAFFGDQNAVVARPAGDMERYMMLADAQTEDKFEEDALNLITVDRMASGVNVEWIPEAAEAVRAEYSCLRWYVVGEGDNYTKLLRGIVLRNVCEQVQPVGKMENPFPYIQMADGYVAIEDENQEEAMGARALGVPVLTLRNMEDMSVFKNWLKELIGGRTQRKVGWTDRNIWIQSIEGER